MNNLRDMTYGLDSARWNMLLDKILVEDIANEIAHFSEEADNTDVIMAPIFIYEVQAKLRLLTTLLRTASSDLNRNYENVDTLTESLFDEVVRGEQSGSHTYPFIDSSKGIPRPGEAKEVVKVDRKNVEGFPYEFGSEPKKEPSIPGKELAKTQ